MVLRINKAFSGKQKRFGFSAETIAPIVGSVCISTLICILTGWGYIEFFAISIFGTLAWMVAVGDDQKRFFAGLKNPPTALRARMRRSDDYFKKKNHGSVK